MRWKRPHISKVYEALTAIADERIEIDSPNHARCYSSSLNKFYDITWDFECDSIMSNDNSAYFTDSLSYPMIAVLLLKNKIAYNKKALYLLRNIHWKKINQQHKNNYDKAIESVLKELEVDGVNVLWLKKEIEKIHIAVCDLPLKQLGQKQQPPQEK